MSLSPRTQITSQPPTAREDGVLSGPRRKRTRKPLKPAEEVQPRKRTHRAAEQPPQPPSEPRGHEQRDPKSGMLRNPREVWEKLPRWIVQVTCSGRLRTNRFRVLIPTGDTYRRHYPANFGCYGCVADAVRVRDEVVKRWLPGVCIWTVLADLKAIGLVPGRVMPRWVRAVEGGFAGRCRWAKVDRPGPYPTPEAAHEAVRRGVERRRKRLRRRREMAG